jgi:hypothetical protein
VALAAVALVSAAAIVSEILIGASIP